MATSHDLPAQHDPTTPTLIPIPNLIISDPLLIQLSMIKEEMKRESDSLNHLQQQLKHEMENLQSSHLCPSTELIDHIMTLLNELSHLPSIFVEFLQSRFNYHCYHTLPYNVKQTVIRSFLLSMEYPNVDEPIETMSVDGDVSSGIYHGQPTSSNYIARLSTPFTSQSPRHIFSTVPTHDTLPTMKDASIERQSHETDNSHTYCNPYRHLQHHHTGGSHESHHPPSFYHSAAASRSSSLPIATPLPSMTRGSNHTNNPYYNHIHHHNHNHNHHNNNSNNNHHHHHHHRGAFQTPTPTPSLFETSSDHIAPSPHHPSSFASSASSQRGRGGMTSIGASSRPYGTPSHTHHLAPLSTTTPNPMAFPSTSGGVGGGHGHLPTYSPHPSTIPTGTPSRSSHFYPHQPQAENHSLYPTSTTIMENQPQPQSHPSLTTSSLASFIPSSNPATNPSHLLPDTMKPSQIDGLPSSTTHTDPLDTTTSLHSHIRNTQDNTPSGVARIPTPKPPPVKVPRRRKTATQQVLEESSIITAEGGTGRNTRRRNARLSNPHYLESHSAGTGIGTGDGDGDGNETGRTNSFGNTTSIDTSEIRHQSKRPRRNPSSRLMHDPAPLFPGSTKRTSTTATATTTTTTTAGSGESTTYTTKHQQPPSKLQIGQRRITDFDIIPSSRSRTSLTRRANSTIHQQQYLPPKFTADDELCEIAPQYVNTTSTSGSSVTNMTTNTHPNPNTYSHDTDASVITLQSRYRKLPSHPTSSPYGDSPMISHPLASITTPIPSIGRFSHIRHSSNEVSIGFPHHPKHTTSAGAIASTTGAGKKSNITPAPSTPFHTFASLSTLKPTSTSSSTTSDHSNTQQSSSLIPRSRGTLPPPHQPSLTSNSSHTSTEEGAKSPRRLFGGMAMAMAAPTPHPSFPPSHLPGPNVKYYTADTSSDKDTVSSESSQQQHQQQQQQQQPFGAGSHGTTNNIFSQPQHHLNIFTPLPRDRNNANRNGGQGHTNHDIPVQSQAPPPATPTPGIGDGILSGLRSPSLPLGVNTSHQSTFHNGITTPIIPRNNNNSNNNNNNNNTNLTNTSHGNSLPTATIHNNTHNNTNNNNNSNPSTMASSVYSHHQTPIPELYPSTSHTNAPASHTHGNGHSNGHSHNHLSLSSPLVGNAFPSLGSMVPLTANFTNRLAPSHGGNIQRHSLSSRIMNAHVLGVGSTSSTTTSSTHHNHSHNGNNGNSSNNNNNIIATPTPFHSSNYSLRHQSSSASASATTTAAASHHLSTPRPSMPTVASLSSNMASPMPPNLINTMQQHHHHSFSSLVHRENSMEKDTKSHILSPTSK